MGGWVGKTELHVYMFTPGETPDICAHDTYRTARMPSIDARYGQERPQDAGEREEALGDDRVDGRSDRSSIFFQQNGDGARTPVDERRGRNFAKTDHQNGEITCQTTSLRAYKRRLSM